MNNLRPLMAGGAELEKLEQNSLEDSSDLKGENISF